MKKRIKWMRYSATPVLGVITMVAGCTAPDDEETSEVVQAATIGDIAPCGPSGLGVNAEGLQVGCSGSGTTGLVDKMACYDGLRPFTDWPLSLIGSRHIYTYCFQVTKNTCEEEPKLGPRSVKQDGWAGDSLSSEDEASDALLGCPTPATVENAVAGAEAVIAARCWGSWDNGGKITRTWQRQGVPTTVPFNYPLYPDSYNIPYIWKPWDGTACYCYEWQRIFRAAAGLLDGNDANW